MLRNEKREEIITVDIYQHSYEQDMEGREMYSKTDCIIRWNEDGIYNALPLIVVFDVDDGKEIKATSFIAVYHAKYPDEIQTLKP